ncbi:MAG: ferrous iron transport protein B [Ignavibacteria bacterium]|nr:ferrous iron transport protein B [Ignavibacteria bacterium]
MNLQTIEKVPLVTLVGPLNSGKTTLFNYLSGKSFKTVNYPGATVEYSISRLLNKFNISANIIDSPGIVSLSANSPDEKISIDALFNHPLYGQPDLLVVTVDSSQLSRHLLLVKQLKSCGFKLIIALTMNDLLIKKKFAISLSKLRIILGCEVVQVDGRTGEGINNLLNTISDQLDKIKLPDGKSEIIQLINNDRHSLLNFYKEIEKIENDVIYEIHSNGNGFDLNAANAQLNVLNPSYEIKTKYTLDSTSLKIDKFLLHPTLGGVFFFLIMAATFTSIFWLADPLMGMVDVFFAFLSSETAALLGSNWFSDFVSSGIISGTGSVLVFLPQILILFLILGLLEDSGYLARGAMIVDKPLSKIGLNGRSFVPMLSGFACAIPAMLAARTIPNRRERILTIFILPLMSCSARLPVYALLIAFLIPSGKSWLGGIILAAIYIFSVTSSIIIASILNKFKHRIIKEEDNSSFIIELPAYRKPKLSFVLTNSYMNAKVYLQKAGPVILAFSIILWFLTYFPNTNPEIDTTGLSEDEIVQVQEVERLSTSYASDLGKLIQPVMTPIGMDWRVGVSLIAAFAAREVFVSSLALIFKVTDNEETFQASMIQSMRQAEIKDTGQKLFTTATITGLIIFFVFALQCLSTVAVSKKETGGWRIPVMQVIIFTSVAYLLTFITVNGLRAVGVN